MLPVRRDGSYEALQETVPNELEETPQDSGVMIHVVESNRSRWNHIEDLDSFFSRMYRYHQKHGFTCMIMQEVLELFQFLFVVSFSTYLFHCVDYPVLFHDKIINSTKKVTLRDVLQAPDECVANLSSWTWMILLVASLFWILRLIKVVYHICYFWDIKLFFNTALGIDDNELDNLTWHEVQTKVRAVQREQEMCIHKRDLSELDIYHRILRFHNYQVAMINKNLLPVRLEVPFIGECVYLSRGLRYNLQLLLFSGPYAPFQNSWHLREDYKKAGKRHELADKLSKYILCLAILNLILCPLILLWQILYAFFNYAEIIKREPGTLGARTWSLYGRLYLRHFNELDHELNARLNRAHKPATRYLESFSSPLAAVISRSVAFICGAVLAVLLILTIYDEDVLAVEHVLTIMTVLGGALAICRALIPDELLVWCPETLLTAVLAHVHYLPEGWRGAAHTAKVRQEFQQIFQYKAVALLEELVSPLVTPYALFRHVRARSLDIVDFFRNFTVSVVGVGDVCSFAQMDVRRHGNPDWQATSDAEVPQAPVTDQYTQAEDGKTELSLVHFTLTNPSWRPPQDAQDFVHNLQRTAQRDRNVHDGALVSSARSMASLGAEYNNFITSIIEQSAAPGTSGDFHALLHADLGESSVLQQSTATLGASGPLRGRLSRAEGPIHATDRGLLGVTNPGMLEFTAADMCLSTLYLHELHHRHSRRRGGPPRAPALRSPQTRLAESTPLLAKR